MLKFNIKEHKLEELEKYGFKSDLYEETDKVLSYTFYYNDYDPQLYISRFTNKLTMFMVLGEGKIKTLDVLYDLIKDGLIIKENK